MASFKKFIKETFYNDMVPAPETNKNDLNDSVEQPLVKYDIILFSGDYDPIHKGEYNRIIKFVNEFIPMNKQLFNENVEIGLICNDIENVEEDQLKENNYELSIKEKQFLTTKLFGLKLYPVNFSGITQIIKLMDTPQEQQELNENIHELVKKFKQSFLTNNALIVLRPSDSSILIEKISNLASNDMNIGTMIYPEEYYEMPYELSNIPLRGKIIKLITLMDHFRPNPEAVRTFCYTYKLKDFIEEAKRIHFRTNNENYFKVFRLLFPELRTTINDDSVNESNAIVIFEMLKKMYLKRDFAY